MELFDTLSSEPTSNNSEVAIIGCGCSSATEIIANVSRVPVVGTVQDVSSCVWHTSHHIVCIHIYYFTAEGVTTHPWFTSEMASVHTTYAQSRIGMEGCLFS